MNYAEVERLLGAAMQVDDRITVDKFRVAAWVEIIDRDMPYEFGITAVKNHYADNTTMLMPAHINKSWRALRLREKETRRTKAIAGVPKSELAPETLAQLDDLRKRFATIADKTNLDKEEAKADGRGLSHSASNQGQG